MRICLVVVLFCALSISVAEKIKPHRDENWPPPALMVMTKSLRLKCMEQTNTALEAIVEFSEGDIHEDPNLKCYFNCVMAEFKVVDEEGVLNYDKMMALIPDDLTEFVDEMSKNCKVPKGDNKCEKAFNYHVCWKNSNPSHYFTI